MSWFVNVVLTLAAAYIAVVGIMCLAQTRLIFPTWLAALGRPELPQSAERMEVKTSEGIRLSGVRLAPMSITSKRALILLGFPGNAWNAEAVALTMHRLVPERDVIVFHYRGYGPSEGRPSAQALFADSLNVFDHLEQELGPRPVIAVGVSIGSAVAAYLARHRRVAGLILVTPFDSLMELARDHYQWAPVRLLLRHRMATVEFVRNLPTPTALIVAGRDTIVPAHRSAPLRRAIPNLVLDTEIADAGHNDIYDLPIFRAAFREALARIELDMATQRSQSQQ